MNKLNELINLSKKYINYKFKNKELENCTIYITGSNVIGFGNFYSDIDLVIISNHSNEIYSNAFDGNTYIISDIFSNYRFDI